MCKNCAKDVDYLTFFPHKIYNNIPIYSVVLYKTTIKELICKLKFKHVKISANILATILFVFLYLMYKLVCRIELGEVFVMQNVRALGLLSNLVFLACLITFVIGITCTYMIFVITVAAAFMTPIISVIRYAFARAVAMKDELDLTV